MSAYRDDTAPSRSNLADLPGLSPPARADDVRHGSTDRAKKWVPVIDAETCTGCNLCIEACGPRCLELIDGIAALSAPNACGSEEHCIPVCAFDAIRMDWVEMNGDRSRGKWRDAPL